MKLVDSHRWVLGFLGVATLLALAAGFGPAAGWAWVTGCLAGLVAAAAAVMALSRLVLGVPGVAAGLAWRAVLALLILSSLGHVAGAFAGGGLSWIGAAGGVLAVLAIALTLILALGFDPMPAAVRALLCLALLVQGAGIAVDGAVYSAARTTSAADFLALLAVELYLLGAVALVAAVRREMFVVRSRPEDVGDLARYLYATSGLFRKVRHPRIGNFTVPGHKLVLCLGRFLSWFPRIAPEVRDKCGVGLWRQFCDLCVVAIRHGLDTQVYYMFELYRPARQARASGYLTRYEMKNGLYKVLTWQVSKTKRRIMLGDKLGMARICEKNGIPTVPILVVAENGNLEFRCAQPSGLQQDLFLKPRQSKGSKGAEVVRYSGGRYVTEDGATLDHDGLIALIARRSKDEPYLVQPLIRNHPGLADLADQALMRIRVVTCLDGQGHPVITHGVLSNLCKLETNWATDIEFGAAIDLETGILGMMTGDKAEMWVDWHENHPVTHARVLGRQVPCWDQVRSIVLAAHAACNDRFLVGWDIAIGPDGAVLLEGNSYPDVDFLQRANQGAIGDSPLGPLLYARLVEIERRSAAGTLRGPMDYDRVGADGNGTGTADAA